MPEDTTEDDDTTKSTRTRWEYIGTLLAAVMVLSLPVLVIGVAGGILTLTGVTQTVFALYAIVTLMAATWAFGKETLEAVQKVRGK
jgi:uncharacterized membrane protein YphA (DoxX/SURF4 family)